MRNGNRWNNKRSESVSRSFFAYPLAFTCKIHYNKHVCPLWAESRKGGRAVIDPYKILEVDYEATDSEIKKAYHALARKYHPDNFASDPKMGEIANRKMREINAAYEQLIADRERGIRGKAAYESAAKAPAQAERAGQSAAPREKETKAKRARTEMPPNFVGYPYIRTMINGASYAAAYGELCRVPEKLRDAEWHYLAGLAHIGLHHLHDAITALDIACHKDKKNAEYRKAREELHKHGASFGEAYGTAHKKNKKEAAPKKKRGWIKRGLLRLFGLDDGEF